MIAALFLIHRYRISAVVALVAGLGFGTAAFFLTRYNNISVSCQHAILIKPDGSTSSGALADSVCRQAFAADTNRAWVLPMEYGIGTLCGAIALMIILALVASRSFRQMLRRVIQRYDTLLVGSSAFLGLTLVVLFASVAYNAAVTPF